MKCYIFAYTVTTSSNQIKLGIRKTLAHSEEEALGIAMKWTKNRFPIEQGYLNHLNAVDLMDVPEQFKEFLDD